MFSHELLHNAMINQKKVFSTFTKYYTPIPLQIFKSDPYKVLISTLLSSRTKDEVTLKASKELFSKAPDIHKLEKLQAEDIKKMIYPVGFYKTKAIHLRKLAEVLINKFSGAVPKTREELMSLPGVGRKTANLVLNNAFDIPAIAVDTHVHKISNLLGWVNTKSPEETEKKLVKLLPKDLWSEVNQLFVSIGRRFNTKKKLQSFLESEGLIKKS